MGRTVFRLWEACIYLTHAQQLVSLQGILVVTNLKTYITIRKRLTTRKELFLCLQILFKNTAICLIFESCLILDCLPQKGKGYWRILILKTNKRFLLLRKKLLSSWVCSIGIGSMENRTGSLVSDPWKIELGQTNHRVGNPDPSINRRVP